jgi:hypothetical protein
MSGTLTSRPAAVKDNDVRDTIESSNASIRIIDNTVIDPQMFSLTLYQDGKAVPLLLKAGNQQITLFDLMSVFDQLGFQVDYHEIR